MSRRRKSRDEIEERLASVRQQQAGAGRALDRYFEAFEEGPLSPPDCQERIGMLGTRVEASVSRGGHARGAEKQG